MNFLEHIEQNAKRIPNNIAISYNRSVITYAQLFTTMTKVAQNAAQDGLGAGSNLLFACQPDIESLSVALGLLYSGAKLTILDPFTSDELFQSRARQAKITHILADPILYTLSKFRKPAQKLLKRQVADIQALKLPLYALGRHYGTVNVKRWTQTGKPSQTLPNPSQNREAIIVFTSGTTSEPKGVVHSLNTLSAHIDDFSEIFGITTGSKVYSEPMTLGLIALSKGGTWIIPAKENQIPSCDVWFGTPVEILAGLNNSANSSIKVIGSGAAPVLPSLVNQINQYHPESQILCVYGMTEILPIAVGNAREKPLYTEGDYVGKPLPKTLVEIRDDEVFVGGEALMERYLTGPVDMLATGDYGKLLPNGELLLLGRKKDMFIRGDMNVYPSLYEPAVSGLTGVNEVVLTGVPNKYGDDELYLIITIQNGYDPGEVLKRVRREMFKLFDKKAVPADVFIWDELPKTGRANKLDRAAVTNQLTLILHQ